jgi:hypothetical protein
VPVVGLEGGEKFGGEHGLGLGAWGLGLRA